MFTYYRNAGARDGIEMVEGKRKGIGWRCLASTNGCGRRGGAGVRKAAMESQRVNQGKVLVLSE